MKFMLNTNEPLKHYAKWKKPVMLDHIWFDSISENYPE